MINWESVRRHFPVTDALTYLNSAAAGPMSRPATQAALGYYRQMMNDGDVHWDTWLAKREAVRQSLATFLNAEPDEIALTTNTSSGMNLIVDALENRGEVISCDLEFPVSTIPWMNRRIPVHLVKAIAGEVTPEHIRAVMNEQTGIVSISHVQFSNGFRIDLEALGQIKGTHALVVNASQSAGVFAIDVKRMNIDALCATGHKWMLAGYGSGFVYISRKLLDHTKPRSIGWLSVQNPYAMRNDEVHLRHDAAARAELGCPHFAGIFALGAAVQLLLEVGTKHIETRALELNRYLCDKLAANGWRTLSPSTSESSRSAETLVAADDPKRLAHQLVEQRVIVTEKPQGIRVATHFFNNEQDIDRLIHAMGERI